MFLSGCVTFDHEVVFGNFIYIYIFGYGVMISSLNLKENPDAIIVTIPAPLKVAL